MFFGSNLLIEKYFRLLKILFLLTGFFLYLSSPSSAQIIKDANTEVELISETLSLKPAQSITVALRMTMDEHWHVYWRNPGDSGFTPEIEWTLPEGFEAQDIQWPYPERINIESLTSYGYEGEVYLTSKILTPRHLNPNTPYTVKAHVKWLACKIECVPGGANLFLTLPATISEPIKNSQWPNDLKSFLPVKEHGWQLNFENHEFDYRLKLIPPEGEFVNLESVYFYPYQNDVIDHAAKQVLTRFTDGHYSLHVKRSDLAKESVDMLEGIIEAKSGWGRGVSSLAIEVEAHEVKIQKSPQSYVGNNEVSHLGLAIIFALLGGLILNLMPCVLPVLSIKVLQLIEHTQNDKKSIMSQALMFAMGVIFMFWILAGIVLVMKGAGYLLGWGFQFQSPIFIVLMAVLFLLLALNQFGLFEFQIAFSQKTKNNGLSGQSYFFNGMLTTLVATPCTAPFMGSALGYGLTQPFWVTFIVFTSLGVGMAMPYCLLAMSPSLLSKLPRPGPWMNALKQFFGFVFLLTVLWLAWVLGQLGGLGAMAFLLFGLLFIALGVWFYSLKKSRVLLILMVLSVLVGANCLYFSIRDHSVGETNNRGVSQKLQWQNYSPELLKQLLESDKTVFLDFTASWCLTCQVNERLVLDRKNVVQKFKEKEVVFLKADWTDYDEDITKLLAEFGKKSIPFYVLYTKGKKGDIISLPELLTTKIVLEALESIP